MGISPDKVNFTARVLSTHCGSSGTKHVAAPLSWLPDRGLISVRDRLEQERQARASALVQKNPDYLPESKAVIRTWQASS